MYGYEMIDTLTQRSNNAFEMKAGTLYPLLHSLVQKKCLEVYQDDASGKMRKYYHLTAVGQKILKEKTQTWHEYSKAVVRIIGGECYGN